MTKEIYGNICLAILLLWGVYVVFTLIRFNQKMMKNKDHFNFQSKLYQDEKILLNRLRKKLFFSFLLVAAVLVAVVAIANGHVPITLS